MGRDDAMEHQRRMAESEVPGVRAPGRTTSGPVEGGVMRLQYIPEVFNGYRTGREEEDVSKT